MNYKILFILIVFSLSSFAIAPTDDMYISSSVTFDSGIFYLTDVVPDYGVLKINASDIAITCNNTIIIGDGTGTCIYNSGAFDNITITGCTIANYTYDVELRGTDDVYFYNNSLQNASYLYSVPFAGTNHWIYGNYFYNATTWGAIVFQDASPSLNTTIEAYIENNTFEDNIVSIYGNQRGKVYSRNNIHNDNSYVYFGYYQDNWNSYNETITGYGNIYPEISSYWTIDQLNMTHNRASNPEPIRFSSSIGPSVIKNSNLNLNRSPGGWNCIALEDERYTMQNVNITTDFCNNVIYSDDNIAGTSYFENVTINNPYNHGYGFYSDSVNDIKNMNITGTRGMYFTSDNNVLENIYLENNELGYHAFQLIGADSNSVTNLNIENSSTGYSGIYLSASNDNIFNGGELNNTFYHINLTGSDRNTFANFTFHNVDYENGILLYADTSDDITFEDNTFSESGNLTGLDAIRLHDCSGTNSFLRNDLGLFTTNNTIYGSRAFVLDNSIAELNDNTISNTSIAFNLETWANMTSENDTIQNTNLHLNLTNDSYLNLTNANWIEGNVSITNNALLDVNYYARIKTIDGLGNNLSGVNATYRNNTNGDIGNSLTNNSGQTQYFLVSDYSQDTTGVIQTQAPFNLLGTKSGYLDGTLAGINLSAPNTETVLTIFSAVIPGSGGGNVINYKVTFNITPIPASISIYNIQTKTIKSILINSTYLTNGNYLATFNFADKNYTYQFQVINKDLTITKDYSMPKTPAEDLVSHLEQGIQITPEGFDIFGFFTVASIVIIILSVLFFVLILFKK